MSFLVIFVSMLLGVLTSACVAILFKEFCVTDDETREVKMSRTGQKTYNCIDWLEMIDLILDRRHSSKRREAQSSIIIIIY